MKWFRNYAGIVLKTKQNKTKKDPCHDRIQTVSFITVQMCFVCVRVRESRSACWCDLAQAAEKTAVIRRTHKHNFIVSMKLQNKGRPHPSFHPPSSLVAMALCLWVHLISSVFSAACASSLEHPYLDSRTTTHTRTHTPGTGGERQDRVGRRRGEEAQEKVPRL